MCFIIYVCTLSEAGALKQLDATLSMDLVALQEIRWLGSGVHNRRGKQCYEIYYSCHDRHRVLGMDFAVVPLLTTAIIDFKAINDRLCTLRIRGKFYNISLINAHAPNEDKEEDEKALFYGRLARTVDACPRHYFLYILREIKVKIGNEPVSGPTAKSTAKVSVVLERLVNCLLPRNVPGKGVRERQRSNSPSPNFF